MREWCVSIAPLSSSQTVMPMTFGEIILLHAKIGLPILDEHTLGKRPKGYFVVLNVERVILDILSSSKE